MIETILHINDDRKVSNPIALEKYISQFEPGKVLLQGRNVKKRSLRQNNWLHVICPDVMAALQRLGWMEIDTPVKAKAFLKEMFFKKTVSNGLMSVDIVQDTSDTDKLLFAERAERIIIWCQEYLGIDVAPPAEQTKMFKEYSNGQ